jgi:hypothetical protein
VLLLLSLCPLVVVPLGRLRRGRSIRFAVGLPGILKGTGSFAFGVPVLVFLQVSLLSTFCRASIWLVVPLGLLLSGPFWVLWGRDSFRCLLFPFGGSRTVWIALVFALSCLVWLALLSLVCSLSSGFSPLLVPVFVSIWHCSSVVIVVGFVCSFRLVDSSLPGLAARFVVVVGLVGASFWINLVRYLRIAGPVHWYPFGS